MAQKMLRWILLLLLVSNYACQSPTQHNKLMIANANTAVQCQEKNGYWYKGQCWADFKDENIAVEEIDRVVQQQMELINGSEVIFNGTIAPIVSFMPNMEDDGMMLIVVLKTATGEKTLLQTVQGVDLEEKGFESPTLLLDGNLLQEVEKGDAAAAKLMENPLAIGELQAVVHDKESLDISFSGTLKSIDEGEDYELTYRSNEALLGRGNSVLEVIDNAFHINGELGTQTYQQLKDAIAAHPTIKTVVLGKVNGSVNDAVNMHTGRILREAGLNTKVLKNSSIASGGVDLFCAGKERIVEKGAKIGIHSWCCVNDLTAIELPKEHPAHQYQLAYFKMCLGEEMGPKFYFHTLSAAPFDGVHWMSDSAIQKWTVSTQLISQ